MYLFEILEEKFQSQELINSLFSGHKLPCLTLYYNFIEEFPKKIVLFWLRHRIQSLLTGFKMP